MARTAAPVPIIPTTSQQNPSFFEQSAKNTLIQMTKISRAAHRGRSASLSRNQEVQTLLDTDFFMIQQDRRSKLTPMQQYRLVHVLAQFFMERAEDANRFSYFEAIFFGREGDSTLHDFRIDIMLQLVSFSLQFPCLQVFNHVSSWLGKVTDQKLGMYYSNLVVEMIVDHYIVTDSKSKMFEYLLPLEYSCGEFSATFAALAPLHGEMNMGLCTIISSFMQKHLLFLLRHLRDTPYLGDQFAKKTFPIFIKYFLTHLDISSKVLRDLFSSVCYIMQRWEEKVIGVGRAATTKTPIDVLDLLLSKEYEWNENRCKLLASAMCKENLKKDDLTEKLEQKEVPLEYAQLTALLTEQIRTDMENVKPPQ